MSSVMDTLSNTFSYTYFFIRQNSGVYHTLEMCPK